MSWTARKMCWGKVLLVCLALAGGSWLVYRYGISPCSNDLSGKTSVASEGISPAQSRNQATSSSTAPQEGSIGGRLQDSTTAAISGGSAVPTSSSQGDPVITKAQLQAIQEIEVLSQTPGLSPEEALATIPVLLKGDSDLDRRESPRTSDIESKCRENKWNEVVAMAQDRLSRDAKDIPALLIYAQHYAQTLDIDNHLATVKKLLQTIKEVNTPFLSAVRPGMAYDLYLQCTRWKQLTAENLQAARMRSESGKGRPLFNSLYFKACEADGVF